MDPPIKAGSYNFHGFFLQDSKLSKYRKQLRELGQAVEGSDEEDIEEAGSENASQNDASEASSYVV